MGKYNDIIVIKLDENLKSKNIPIGTHGTLISSSRGTSRVLLYDKNNMGEYCVIDVDNSLIEYDGEMPKVLIQEMDEFFKNTNFESNTHFNIPKFKEYDLAEVMVEKEKYAKHGIHKGMIGTIMQPYAIKSEWYVIFTDEKTGIDIADICVHQDDMIKIK